MSTTCVRQELRRVDRKSSKGVEEDKIHIYATDANGSLLNVSSVLVKIWEEIWRRKLEPNRGRELTICAATNLKRKEWKLFAARIPLFAMRRRDDSRYRVRDLILTLRLEHYLFYTTFRFFSNDSVLFKGYLALFSFGCSTSLSGGGLW